MDDKGKVSINFRVYPVLPACIGILVLLVFSIVLEVLAKEFDLITTVISVFIAIGAIFMAFNSVDEVRSDGSDAFTLRKTFKSYVLKKSAVSNFRTVKFGPYVFLKLVLNDERSLWGYYFYAKIIHEEFSTFLQDTVNRQKEQRDR